MNLKHVEVHTELKMKGIVGHISAYGDWQWDTDWVAAIDFIDV